MTVLSVSDHAKATKLARKARAAVLKKAADKEAADKKSEAKRAATKMSDEIVHQIQEELCKIRRNEGYTVLGLIAIGVQLKALQEATRATRDWARRVEQLGLNARTARRLQELGAAAFGQTATRTVAALRKVTGEIADDVRNRLRKALDEALAAPGPTPEPATPPATDAPVLAQGPETTDTRLDETEPLTTT